MKPINDMIRVRENNRASPAQWGLTVYGIIILRNFLEGIVFSKKLGFSSFCFESVLRCFIYYPLNYLSGAFSIIIVLHLFSRERIDAVARVVLSFFWVILIPPLIDFFVFKGRYFPLGYLPSIREALQGIVFIFDFTRKLSTVSYGVRIELLLILILSWAYLWAKTQKRINSLLGGLCSLWSVLLVAGSIPVLLLYTVEFPWTAQRLGENLLRELSIKGTIFSTQDSLYALVYSFVFSILLLIYYSCYDFKKFKALLKNVRPFRVIHFLLLAFLGMGYFCLLQTGAKIFLPAMGLILPAFALGFCYCAQSLAVINDIVDKKGDCLTNRDRPLVTGILTETEYREIGTVCAIMSAGIFISISYYAFLMVLTFWVFYFIYSSPPLHLKKIFPLNMSVIAVNGLVMFLSGISVFAGADSFSYIRGEIAWVIFLPFFLGINMITLKDFAGDKQEKVFTLPVLLGQKKGKSAVALLSLTAFILPGIILSIYWLVIPGIVLGTSAVFFMLCARWREWIFFLHYYAYFSLVIISYWNKIR